MSVTQRVCKICMSTNALRSFEIRDKICHGVKTLSKTVVPIRNNECSSNFNALKFERYFHDNSRRLLQLQQPSNIVVSQVRYYTASKEGVVPQAEHDITKLYRTKILYKNILESFPHGIQMAFAYGSGAIKQEKEEDMSKNVLDFIFVVDDPIEWHELNLKSHSHHYSSLRFIGSQGLAKIQDRYGGATYFNTLVPMHGRIIKYGVISTQKLINDLLDWESLYISGRLHKPVNLIIAPKDSSLIEAMIDNLESAVHTALLILPDVFSEKQLYTTIAGLSYSGDIRMGVAENSNKVQNIVKPNMEYFRRMYLPIIMKFEHVVFWQETGQLEQALTFESRHYHLTHLPSQVLQGLLKKKYQKGVFPDLEEVVRVHAYDTECGAHVLHCVSQIVHKSSVSQTMKGILMAGVLKSLRYGFSKVMKKIKSR